MATWRVTVTCTDAETAEAFKDTHYKQLYQASGTSLTFEVPETDEAGADAIVAAAKEAGFEAAKERFEDPLESADTAVDFW